MLLAACAVVYLELTKEDDQDRVGEGPEPSPGPRFGCTDPFAKNWDPQAERFGQVGSATSINNAMNGQVCTYDQRFGEVSSAMDIPGLPRNRAWHFTDWVRGGGYYDHDSYQDSFMGNVCYDDTTDEVVIRHWDANRDNPKAKSPLMACHDGEIMLGVVEQSHLVLDQREGAFEETEYSTGNWAGLGVSVMVPPDGMRFDRTYYFENMYDETNPPDYPGAGQLPEYTLMWHTGTNPVGPNAYQLITSGNKRTMQKRGIAAADPANNRGYKDNMYGALWRVGDPRIGTLGDFDLDKDGRIASGSQTGSPHENALLWTSMTMMPNFNASGIQNQNGIFGYSGEEEGIRWNWSTPEQWAAGPDEFDEPYVHLMGFDLDKDDRYSFWEAAHVARAHSTAGRAFGIETPGARVWFPYQYGMLGYDGAACADREEIDMAQVACFPFSEQSMDMLEVERQRLADTHPWYSLNTDEVQQARSHLNEVAACMRDGGEWAEAFDEVQEMMLMQGQTDGAWQPVPMRQMGLDFCIKLKSAEYGFDPDDLYPVYYGDRPYEMVPMDTEDVNAASLPSQSSPYHPMNGGPGEYPNDPPCYSQSVGMMMECERVYVDIPKESDLPVTGIVEAKWAKAVSQHDDSPFGPGGQFFMGSHPFFETFQRNQYNWPFDWNENSGDLVIARNSCPSSHPYFVRLCSVSETSDHLVGETIDIDYNELPETENE